MDPIYQEALKFTFSPVEKNSAANALSKEEEKLNWEWYYPPQDTAAVIFCHETGLHGLKYVVQKERHICERLFWLSAFVASVITATVFIWIMWKDYRNMPIVTVFNPTETTLDVIPFPSVTICNVNSLQKSEMDKHVQVAQENWQKTGSNASHSEEFQRSIAKFIDMEYICDSSKSFMDRFMTNTTFDKWFKENKIDIKDSKEFEKYINPTATLRNVSQPCDKMILHCIWQDEERNCSELFQQIETDYGYCCTFNTMPVSLLLKHSENITDDNPEMVNEWMEANLSYENLMLTEETKSRKYPRTQTYPGKTAGLSILLNPELDEYFCPHTDSEGFMLGVNVPIDYPRMKENSIPIKTSSEVFVGVRPEITLSGQSMRDFPLEKRGCYYGNDFELPHYTMFTATNCMGECIARQMLEECNCLRYHMPRGEGDALCKPDQYNCTEAVEKDIYKYGLNSLCEECLPTCTEIEYLKSVMHLRLQKEKVKDFLDEHRKDYDADDVSIVHIFFNMDSVYPRLRKELTTTTQLLSNAGGIMGLCMGFSVLSLLEIIYYCTMRICFGKHRENAIRKQQGKHDTNDNGYNGSAVKAKQGWFSKVLNGGSGISNIENRIRNIQITRPHEEAYHYDHVNNVFQIRNRDNPFYRGSIENQIVRAFLAGTKNTGYTYTN